MPDVYTISNKNTNWIDNKIAHSVSTEDKSYMQDKRLSLHYWVYMHFAIGKLFTIQLELKRVYMNHCTFYFGSVSCLFFVVADVRNMDLKR